jgi:hypothetical protein
MRPPLTNGAVWPLAVTTDQTGALILDFDGLSSVPGQFGMYAHIPERDLKINLRETNRVELKARPHGTRSLAVVVGTPEYIGRQLGTVPGLPARTRLLEWGPNPSRGSTVFRYQVHRSGPVEFGIAAVNGTPLVRLAAGWQEPGYYTLTWDGRDSRHQPVVPGLYLARLSGNGCSRTITLLILGN